MFPLHVPLHLVDRWAVGSQLQARRNAMVASMALAQRRAEATEVAEFLTSLAGHSLADRSLPTGSSQSPATAHG